MKSSYLLSLAVALCSINISQAGVTPLSLSEMVKKVGTADYVVLDNALRVYQAKEGVQVARANLLPKLNFWKIVSIPFDPKSALGVIEDIAPFLVPANWLRVEEEKLFLQAQRQGYRALWGNEVLTAKAIYLRALADQSLYSSISSEISDLEQAFKIAETREILGGAPVGLSQDLRVRILSLQEDQKNLSVVLNDELSFIAYLSGFKGNESIELKAVSIPDMASLEPLNYPDFEFRALDSSPEIRQYDHLIEAADYVKQERYFSFLGGSSMSRNVAGGVFDGLPEQNGLGFGLGPSVRIVQAQKKILQIQRQGVQETVRRSLKVLTDNYNLDLGSVPNLKKRMELTRDISSRIRFRIQLGDAVDPIELIEASRNQLQAEASWLALQYRFLANEDRLNRLIFNGDYSAPPNPIQLAPKGELR